MADGQRDPSSNTQSSILREQDVGGQAGLANLVAARIFGSAPLPPGTPEWLKDSIDTQANFAQRLPGADVMTIGGAGGGPLDLKTKRERQRDADAEAVEYLTVRLEQAERERRQWAGERHGIGGVEMTGAEWSQLSERLRTDDELKQRVLDAFRSRGMTSAEAETRYDRVADVAGAMAIPPSQRTEQQAAAVSKAEADPSFKRDIQTVQTEYDRRSSAAPTSSTTNDAGRDQQSSAPVTILAGPAF